MISRQTALKILNPILLVLLINMILTGALHDVMPLQLFGVMHEGGGGLLSFGVLIHIILNWNWIKANYWPKKSKSVANQ